MTDHVKSGPTVPVPESPLYDAIVVLKDDMAAAGIDPPDMADGETAIEYLVRLRELLYAELGRYLAEAWAEAWKA